MRKVLVIISLLTALAVIFSCSSDDKKNAKSTTSVKPKEKKKVDGKKIYKMNCVICHGADGKLGINGAGDITISELTFEEKVTLITKGKGVMTPFENTLKKEQIEAVTKYTESL